MLVFSELHGQDPREIQVCLKNKSNVSRIRIWQTRFMLNSLIQKISSPKNTKPTAVRFDTQDSISGITHSTSKNPHNIIIKESGVYFICAAAQAGRSSGKHMRFIDMWVRHNKKDVPNSNVRYGAPSSLFDGDTLVLITQTLLPMKTGDILNIMFSVNSSDGDLGFIATHPKNEPTVPSIIFSMYKI